MLSSTIVSLRQARLPSARLSRLPIGVIMGRTRSSGVAHFLSRQVETNEVQNTVTATVSYPASYRECSGYSQSVAEV